MKYNARISNDGRIIIVFKDNFQRPDTVEITEEVYNTWLQHRDWIYNNGQLQPRPEKTLSLSELKTLKYAEIKRAFQDEVKYGVLEFTIPSSNMLVTVDARRNSSDNDLQNLDGLISFYRIQVENSIKELVRQQVLSQKPNATEAEIRAVLEVEVENFLLYNPQSPVVMYKCANNEKYPMKFSDLLVLRNVFIQRGIQLYAKKHYLEDLVAQATTKEQIESIKW